MILEGTNLCVGFDDKQVLHNITIQIEKGTVLSILGPNGCGKSTLLKTLSRSLKPSNGQVFLNEKNIWQLAPQEIAKQMAVLPQGPQAPADLTVRDLVFHGRYPHQRWWKSHSSQDEQWVEWALQETGLLTMAGRGVSTLSGGERQRVWIAMALAQQPQVLLLDEPTTYLDICHQLEIMELLNKMNQEHGLTIVMVLHDIHQAVRYSKEVMVMRQGKVFVRGTPEQVVTPETLRQVFGVESFVCKDETGKLSVQIQGLSLNREQLQQEEVMP